MLRNFDSVRHYADTDDVLQNATKRLLRALEEIRPASMRDFCQKALEIAQSLAETDPKNASAQRDLAVYSVALNRFNPVTTMFENHEGFSCIACCSVVVFCDDIE